MKIAVGQTNSGVDPRENATTLVAMVETAAKADAKMLFTPEMSGLLDRDRVRASLNITTEANDIVLYGLPLAALHWRESVKMGDW
jgi:deaminated glutathione amidase